MIATIEEQTRLWDEYVTAFERMHATMKFEDGAEAARAYRRFYKAFCGSDEMPEKGEDENRH